MTRSPSIFRRKSQPPRAAESGRGVAFPLLVPRLCAEEVRHERAELRAAVGLPEVPLDPFVLWRSEGTR